jgi:hypothetical protein
LRKPIEKNEPTLGERLIEGVPCLNAQDERDETPLNA